MPFAIKVLVFNSAGEEVVLLYQGGISQMAGAPSLSGTLVQAGSLGVNMIFTGTLASGGQVLSWAGESNNGNPVKGGTYYVSIVSTDIFGTVSTYNLTLSVVEPKGSNEVNIFNSAGELVYQEQFMALSGSATVLDLEAGAFVPAFDSSGTATSKLTVTLHDNFGASIPWSWDGKNSKGQLVQPGIYTIQLINNIPGSSSKVVAKQVQVLAALDASSAAPKLTYGPDGIIVHFNPAAALGSVGGRLYNLAGELVGNCTAAAPGGALRVDLKGMASGIYVLIFDYTAPSGSHKRVVLKAAVLK